MFLATSLVILVATVAYAQLGGWLVCAAVGLIFALLPDRHEIRDVSLLIAAAVLGLVAYDFWWHTLPQILNSQGHAGLEALRTRLLVESALMLGVLVKAIKIF